MILVLDYEPQDTNFMHTIFFTHIHNYNIIYSEHFRYVIRLQLMFYIQTPVYIIAIIDILS